MEHVAASDRMIASPNPGDKHDERPPTSFRPILNPTSPVHNEASNGDRARSSESSSVSSVNPDLLGDEIIVGMHGNGDKPSPLRVVSDAEDDATAEAADPVSHYPKRKRASVYNDLSEDKMDTSMADDGVDIDSRESQRRSSGPKTTESKSVILGYWRESPVPDPAGKHAVAGFMDVRDRLRTRIQCMTRLGGPINPRLFPIPPGPGGGWVTFERIVFENHLVGLDHNEIKEYVKIVADMGGSDSIPESRRGDIERRAVFDARRHLEMNPPAEMPLGPVAYGLEIPDNAQVSRQEHKRRRLNSIHNVPHQHPVGTFPNQISGTNPPTPTSGLLPGPVTAQQPHVGVLDSLPGTRPTRILVGAWAKSDVRREEDRHAVYGILGANDMFRVKLVRETLDGRYVDGNFPAGAGALWIPYEEVIFLRHIKHLSRPEMKEYVRVRQRQIDDGEKEEDKVANETKAVYEAQTRARAQAAASHPKSQSSLAANVMPRPPLLLGDREEAHELRQHRHDMVPRNELAIARHALPQHDMRHLPRPPSIDIVDRIDGLATREVNRMEVAQQRQDRQQQSRLPMGNAGMVEHMEHPGHGQLQRPQFQDNRDRMQKVWAAQEQNRLRASVEDTKMHMGIKYERKLNGPFAGKLVSQGAIITIDGEDYVEYRVLTKPTFF
ncbi:hypothetical protein F5Y17DRAFT_142595 [Xylariaceae sp. FL0594]|nr:hypothetical protein F5Y17DRAFT_142595 [Xylariaceae sp. FL0594]